MTLIEKEANKRGLYVNEHKTKYMTVERERKLASVKENKFKTVNDFKYLGVMINNRNDRRREKEHRIQAGNWVYYKYKSIMKSKEINRKTTMKVYKVGIQEKMILRKGEEEKLEDLRGNL